MKKLVAIILARKGSKGVPNKNIKLLNGKPLISWTIEAAIKSKSISKIIISTDDPKIAEISKLYKLEIDSFRPENLSNDEATSDSVVLYELKKLTQKFSDVILLQPTSPLRTHVDIENSVNEYFLKKYKSMVSVKVTSKNVFWCFTLNENGSLRSIVGLENMPKSRQDFPKTYELNGAIKISNINLFLKKETFLNDFTMPYIMDEISSLDIDNLDDFKIAENFFKSKG